MASTSSVTDALRRFLPVSWNEGRIRLAESDDMDEESHPHLSPAVIEQKCALITKELDSHGMGRYQWNLWFLCGFGYMLDLMMSHAFGLVLGPLSQELGFADSKSGQLAVAFSVGLTAGAFIWGILGDIIGRKLAFNLTCFIAAVFCLGLGACNTYTSFLVVTAFTGFGVGGNLPIDSTCVMEFVPQNRRFLLALLSIFQPVGVIITSGLAYAFIPNFSCSPNFSKSDPLPSCHNVKTGARCCTKANNMGWRYLLLSLGSITLVVFILRFFVFSFQESPKFLVTQGRDAEAIGVLQRIAQINKKTCGLTKADFDAVKASSNEGDEAAVTGTQSPGAKLGRELGRYRLLFSDWVMTRITVLIWLTYAMDFWGFTLAGAYLPRILALKNGARDKSLEYTYKSYLAVYTPAIIAVVGSAMMYRVSPVARKVTATVAVGLMAVSIVLFGQVNSDGANIGLTATEYFFQSVFNSILYGYTPELFPTAIRGTACGIASFWGRLFSIIAPLTAQGLIPKSGLDEAASAKILYLAGVITMGCVVTMALLPNRIPGRE